MATLKQRLDQLENKAGVKSKAERERDEAGMRVTKAICAAAHAVHADALGFCSDLDERIKAGATTEVDDAFLASIPTDALAVMNTTAAEYVALLAEVDKII